MMIRCIVSAVHLSSLPSAKSHLGYGPICNNNNNRTQSSQGASMLYIAFAVHGAGAAFTQQVSSDDDRTGGGVASPRRHKRKSKGHAGAGSVERRRSFFRALLQVFRVTR